MKKIDENAKSVISNYLNYKVIAASKADMTENKIMTISAVVSKMVAEI